MTTQDSTFAPIVTATPPVPNAQMGFAPIVKAMGMHIGCQNVSDAMEMVYAPSVTVLGCVSSTACTFLTGSAIPARVTGSAQAATERVPNAFLETGHAHTAMAQVLAPAVMAPKSPAAAMQAMLLVRIRAPAPSAVEPGNSVKPAQMTAP